MNNKRINSTEEHLSGDDYISKTSIKKAMHDLQALGEQLLELPVSQLDRLTLSTPLLEALSQAKKIKVGNTRRRQIQYIGKLMRSEDIEHITNVLEDIKRESRNFQKTISVAQHWLQQLVTNKQLLAEFIKTYPQCDRKKAYQLLRQLHQKGVHADNKQNKHRQQLFIFLQETINLHSL